MITTRPAKVLSASPAPQAKLYTRAFGAVAVLGGGIDRAATAQERTVDGHLALVRAMRSMVCALPWRPQQEEANPV